MKILLVTQYFYPENFKCNDMAFELKQRGHDITVLTAIPNYPTGHYFKGYGLFRRRTEIINGVKVIRTPVIPRGKGGGLKLALNYLSYTIFSSIYSIFLSLKNKYDTIFVHEPSPILVGIPAIISKKINKSPLHFWILDLWPESLSAAGGIRNKKILVLFEKITKWIYRNCDTLLIGSKGYRKSINQKGDFDAKIEYFPNWIEEALTKPRENTSLPYLPTGFNIVIAGNMGDAQDLPHVMDAAKLLKGTNINFIFIGDGRKKEYVERFVKENRLENQVFCLGRFPLDSMSYFFHNADILFFALKNTPIFALTVPSRLQAYMSSGKPVVAMINGEGAELLEEADCGWSVPAESSESLATLLLKLSHENRETLKTKGLNGKKYSESNFNFIKCIDHLEQIMTKAVNTKSNF